MTMLCRALRVLVGLLMVALVCVVALGIFYRYALQNSLYWATEVPNFLMVWIVMLGSVVAFHERGHIAFTLLGETLGGRGQALLECVGILAVLTLLAVLAYSGAIVVEDTMHSLSDALRIPKGYLYACLPLCAVLMMISALGQLRSSVRRLRS
ncbi:TRAP transporter small permease [Castellaniella sp. GW247-6E4]|uniref:TRAP transporter small permease n=1 Tax=Castellaniella sp. GW247-6E4 TaxID=3140380 RepID=UPI003315ECF4